MSTDKEHSGCTVKAFDYLVGCAQVIGTVIGIIALIISFIGLVWAIRNQEAAIQIVRVVSGDVTSTPVIIVLPTGTPLPTYTPQPGFTSLPTYTPYPTYTPHPTHTPYLTSTPTSTPVRKVSLPFADNFDAGLKPEWVTLSGDWRIANGRLTTLTRDKFSYVFVGDLTWQDYVIDVDFDDGGGSLWGEPVAIIVRAQDINNFVMFALELHTSYWKVRQEGEWKELIKGEGSYWHRPSNSRGHLRVEIRGNFYKAYFDDTSWISINDNTFAKGQVGLGIYCEDTCATFDNFKVSELK